jgi:hypothetical protein
MIIYLGNECSFEDMLRDLRENRCVDVNNDLSDEFLIQESYDLEEWDYKEDI